MFQEMEDESFIKQWMSAAFDQESANHHHPQHSLLYDDVDNYQLLPYMINTTIASPAEDYLSNNNRPQKQLKSNSWGSSCIINNEPAPSPEPHNNSHVAAASSFFYPPNPPGHEFTINRLDDHHRRPVWTSERNDASIKSCQLLKSKTRTMSTASARTPLAQDHVNAERKRREKLSQRFIALSAIIPGLKKTDKASVLADAIKYVKQLQERVETLEDQTKRKAAVNESVVVVKKSKLLIAGENKPMAKNEQVPEIEVKVCDKDVLIRIHCDNNKGVIEKVIGEISKLNLTISNTSVVSFGSCALDITIVAQIDAKCCMTFEELVTSLREGFMSFM